MAFDQLIKDWKNLKLERKRFNDDVKRHIIESGRGIFLRYGIKKVVLFGSISRACGEPGSDVDLYVSPLPVEKYWRFRHDLEERLDLPVDLYGDGDDPKFIKKVIERGDTVFEA